MKRTSFMLPEELRRRARKRAEEIGVSFGDLMRKLLEAEVGAPVQPPRRGGTPTDLSANVDHYLYGRKKKASS